MFADASGIGKKTTAGRRTVGFKDGPNTIGALWAAVSKRAEYFAASLAEFGLHPFG